MSSPTPRRYRWEIVYLTGPAELGDFCHDVTSVSFGRLGFYGSLDGLSCVVWGVVGSVDCDMRSCRGWFVWCREFISFKPDWAIYMRLGRVDGKILSSMFADTSDTCGNMVLRESFLGNKKLVLVQRSESDVRTCLLGGAIDGSKANRIIRDSKLEFENSRGVRVAREDVVESLQEGRCSEVFNQVEAEFKRSYLDVKESNGQVPSGTAIVDVVPIDVQSTERFQHKMLRGFGPTAFSEGEVEYQGSSRLLLQLSTRTDAKEVWNIIEVLAITFREMMFFLRWGLTLDLWMSLSFDSWYGKERRLMGGFAGLIGRGVVRFGKKQQFSNELCRTFEILDGFGPIVRLKLNILSCGRVTENWNWEVLESVEVNLHLCGFLDTLSIVTLSLISRQFLFDELRG
ncbi:hypothetical protein Tco_0313100 [Tanacetum coccineum]